METSFNKFSFDFLKYRMVALGLFVVMSIVGLITFQQKGFNLGADFAGGIRIEFTSPLSIEEIRETMTNDNVAITTLKNTAGEESFQLTAPAELGKDGSGDYLLQAIRDKNNDLAIIASEYIGPSVGSDFASQALRLLMIVAGLILVYVAFRFDFVYGIGAIAALFHDMWMMLVITLVFQIPVDLTTLAAFLTVLGYSINDTIVIFDRVRENHELAPSDEYYGLINKSISQSFKRTILTSVTTLFVALAIYIWAGNSLKNFGLLLSFGIFFGTYSSLFVASPITAGIWTYQKNHKK